jgi:hypothetical protein
MARLTSVLVLNVNPETRESLEREAARERRPLAAMARKILEEFFEAGHHGYRLNTKERGGRAEA